MQIRQAREDYVRWLVARDLSPHTIRAYNSDIAHFERYVGDAASIELLDRDRVLAFIDTQRSAGLSAVSTGRRASSLRGFCKWLAANRILLANPLADTAITKGRSRTLPSILQPHELDSLLLSLKEHAGIPAEVNGASTAPIHNRPHDATTLLAVALMVVTGVRVAEVVSIRTRDIDLRSRSLRLLGKGRRERQVFLTNDWITTLTSAYLEARHSLGVTHSRLLFNVRRDPLTASALRTRLAHAAHAAGLSTNVTPHMLRHTAATRLIEAGVDIRYIQRLLGHASLTTTEVYTHVSDTALKRVVSDADVLGEVLQMR